MRYGSVFFVLLFSTQISWAEVVEDNIEYQQGQTVLEGYIVYDDALVQDNAPAVLVVHDWMGFSEYQRTRARQLAELGYVAMAVDIYGKGVRPQNTQEAWEVSSLYKKNRQLMRDRISAALETLREHLMVNPARIGAMGYCFGGAVALELAREGEDVRGIVTFHGGLDASDTVKTENIKAKVLVLHGADDPLVPPQQVAAFQDEMREAGADWQMVFYGDAVHSFTQPDAGSDKSKGVAYNKKADERSWVAMKNFFQEVL